MFLRRPGIRHAVRRTGTAADWSLAATAGLPTGYGKLGAAEVRPLVSESFVRQPVVRVNSFVELARYASED